MDETKCLCPINKELCKASNCQWWSKWVDEFGTTHQACVVSQIADRLFEIADVISEKKE